MSSLCKNLCKQINVQHHTMEVIVFNFYVRGAELQEQEQLYVVPSKNSADVLLRDSNHERLPLANKAERNLMLKIYKSIV